MRQDHEVSHTNIFFLEPLNDIKDLLLFIVTYCKPSLTLLYAVLGERKVLL